MVFYDIIFKRNLGFLFVYSPVLFVSNLFSNVFHNYSAIVIEGRPWSRVLSPRQVPQSVHLYFCRGNTEKKRNNLGFVYDFTKGIV